MDIHIINDHTVFDKYVILSDNSVSGNPDLCVTGKSCTQTTAGDSTPVAGGRKKKSSKLPVILGTSIPGFFVFWGIVGLVAVLHHRRKSPAIPAHGSGN